MVTGGAAAAPCPVAPWSVWRVGWECTAGFASCAAGGDQPQERSLGDPTQLVTWCWGSLCGLCGRALVFKARVHGLFAGRERWAHGVTALAAQMGS